MNLLGIHKQNEPDHGTSDKRKELTGGLPYSPLIRLSAPSPRWGEGQDAANLQILSSVEEKVLRRRYESLLPSGGEGAGRRMRGLPGTPSPSSFVRPQASPEGRRRNPATARPRSE